MLLAGELALRKQCQGPNQLLALFPSTTWHPWRGLLYLIIHRYSIFANFGPGCGCSFFSMPLGVCSDSQREAIQKRHWMHIKGIKVLFKLFWIKHEVVIHFIYSRNQSDIQQQWPSGHRCDNARMMCENLTYASLSIQNRVYLSPKFWA